MKILQEHIVPPNIQKERLSDYAVGLFPGFIFSRKGTKKAIKKGTIFLNGKIGKTGDWVESGFIVHLIESEHTRPKVFSHSIPIIYEDNFLAVIQKPAGLIVSGNLYRTVTNALPFNLTPSPQPNAYLSPRPAHRLDKSTSGLLLVAKTPETLIELGRQFEKRLIRKRYQAVVIGKPKVSDGEILLPIKNKRSITKYQLIDTVPSLRSERLSLLNLWPETGRTHQLRIHLSTIGHPILGDKIYGQNGLIMKGKGLFLAAVQLTFTHPITQQIQEVSIEAPPKFERFMRKEKERWEKYRGQPKTVPNS